MAHGNSIIPYGKPANYAKSFIIFKFVMNQKKNCFQQSFITVKFYFIKQLPKFIGKC
jgi:hypothetical protein